MSNLVSQSGIKELMSRPEVQRNIQELTGSPQGAKAFSSALINAVRNNHLLSKCDPNSILFAAVAAATLNLPINENLGYAYLIPYGNKCQFQMGYKGLIQLAQRSGLYQTINATDVREGEIIHNNRMTGEISFDWIQDAKERIASPVVGYMAYFSTVTGFSKSLYMTKEDVESHGKKYSKTYSRGPWSTDFDAMASKTVLKLLLSKYGPISIEMQEAHKFDQAIVKDFEGTVVYEDNPQTAPDLKEIEHESHINRIREYCDKATSPEDLTLVLDMNKHIPEYAEIIESRIKELQDAD